LAGALAGATFVLFTYLLELLRVRLAFETETKGFSLVGMVITIDHERSLSDHLVTHPQSTSAIMSRNTPCASKKDSPLSLEQCNDTVHLLRILFGDNTGYNTVCERIILVARQHR